MRSRLLGFLVIVPLLSACGKWEARGNFNSPDGQVTARIEVKLRGASGQNLTKIILGDGEDGKSIPSGEIVSAEGAIVDATRVAWNGPDELRVVLCEATAYRTRARLLRDPVTRADGTDNAIAIRVENWRYSETLKRCIPG